MLIAGRERDDNKASCMARLMAFSVGYLFSHFVNSRAAAAERRRAQYYHVPR